MATVTTIEMQREREDVAVVNGGKAASVLDIAISRSRHTDSASRRRRSCC
jgi:hypothetical protein